MRFRLAVCLFLALLLPNSALAQERQVNVRVGDHPSFGRLVFDWPVEVPYTVAEQPGRIILRFGEPARFDLARARRGVRNLGSIEAAGEAVTISVAAGVRPRHFRVRSFVVLDLLDPGADPNTPAASPAASPRPTASGPTPASPVGTTTVSPPAQPRVSPATVGGNAAPSTSPAPPPQGVPAVAAVASPAAREAATAPPAMVRQGPAPPAILRDVPPAVELPAPEEPRPQVQRSEPTTRSVIALPFPSGTGAAVLAHGGSLVITFDAGGELDLAMLRGWFPGAEGLSIEGTRNATTLLLPLEAADLAGVRLTLGGAGWQLERGHGQGLQDPREITPDGPAGEGLRRVMLPMANPGRVVTLREPGGERLIQVGPSANGPLAALSGPSRPLDGATLLGTRLGVAVLLDTDDVTLRRVEGGFLVSLPPREQVVEDLSTAAPLPRLLDLHDLPLEDLLAQRAAATRESAAAPTQARGSARLRLAETLIGLGLGFEALGVLDTAIEDDPRLITSPRAMLLVGAAATLAGRESEATSALSSPRLDEQPEARLWRGLAAAMSSQRNGVDASEEAAAAIAAGAPILFSYPSALRARLVPGAAEALAFGSHQPRAAGLLRDSALRDSPQAALAQARLLEAQGRLEPALAAYGMLTTSRDPLVRSRALERLAELRLVHRRDDAGRAARLMESAFMAWRGDEREQRLRIRTAELQRQAGQHGSALSLLSETLALFPSSEATIRPLLDASFPMAMEDGALPLSEALRLAELFGPTVQPAPAAALAMSALARRLMAQELPIHAAQALRIGLARAPDSGLQARLSVELAAALLDGDRLAEARRSLAELPVSTAPPAIRSQRIAIEAELLRRSGEMQAAADLMRQAQTPDPLTLSEILAARQDWMGASQALARHIAATVPAAPEPLNPAHRDLLVRVAAFASLAGDEEMLATLRRDFGPRIGSSPEAGGFIALIEADAARSQPGAPTSLSRQQRELLAAQRLQEQLRTAR